MRHNRAAKRVVLTAAVVATVLFALPLFEIAPAIVRLDHVGSFMGCSQKAWRVDEPLDKWADGSFTQPKEIPMLWTIVIILVVLWLLGSLVHIGGSLINLLLVIAVIVVIINLIQRRRGP